MGEGTEDSGARRSTRRAGRDLPVAIGSGIALAALFVGATWWHPYALLALVAVIVAIGCLELGGAFRDVGLRPSTSVAIGAGLVTLVGAVELGGQGQALGLAVLVVGGVLGALLGGRGESLGGRTRGRTVASLGSTLLMGLWLPFFGSFIALLVTREHGAWVVLAVIALTVSNDISAYGFGAAFGRRKLAPRISPGKTWEGAAGGLAMVLLLAALITARLPGFDLPTALLLAVAVVPAATLGDLAESLVKRDLGVKDLGRVLPGHGGIMDRVDGIVFALPAAHYVLLAAGA